MKFIKKLAVATVVLGLATSSMLAQEKWPEKLVFGGNSCCWF